MSPSPEDYNLYVATITYSLVAAIEKTENFSENVCLDIMQTHLPDIHEWNPPRVVLAPVTSENDLPEGWEDNVSPYTVVADNDLPATLKYATIADFLAAQAACDEIKKLKEANDAVKSMNTFLLGHIAILEKEIEELKKAQKRQ
jgi:hypothetical protein